MDMAVRQVIRNMNLKYIIKGKQSNTFEYQLLGRNVTSLRKLGKMYGVVGFSHMDMQTIIPCISHQMTTQSSMEPMLRILDEASWEFFQRAVQKSYQVDDEASPINYQAL